jgi:benzoyl-CoA 2,3-dioxygenase component B
VERIVQRSAELMKADPNGDARNGGGIDLNTVQKWINFWFSSAVELFGGEISSNAADYFATGLKGRFREREKYGEHKAMEGVYTIEVPENGRLVTKEVPLRNALNEILRDEYVADCERAVRKWNHTIKKAGVDYEIRLPHRRFNRSMGLYSTLAFTPTGELISRDEFEARKGAWLPTEQDRAYVRSLMVPVTEKGKIANWIAPPKQGVDGKPFDWEYVRFEA